MEALEQLDPQPLKAQLAAMTRNLPECREALPRSDAVAAGCVAVCRAVRFTQ